MRVNAKKSVLELYYLARQCEALAGHYRKLGYMDQCDFWYHKAGEWWAKYHAKINKK